MDESPVTLPRNASLKKTTVDVDPGMLAGSQRPAQEGGTFYEDKSRLSVGGRESLDAIDLSLDFKRSVEMERNEQLGLPANMV